MTGYSVVSPTFSITIINLCPSIVITSTTSFTTLYFKIGDTPQTFSWPDWTLSYSFCGSVVYSLTGAPTPEASVSSAAKTLTLTSLVTTTPGTHAVVLVGTVGSVSQTYPFTIVFVDTVTLSHITPTSLQSISYIINDPIQR